jgi:hypothetical protein
MFARAQREYLSLILGINLRSCLLALLPANSGESFPKIGIDAFGVTKGTIEDRFH